MKAIIQSRYGAPSDVLEVQEIDTPVPREDEVLVRVEAAPIAGDDWHLMRGRPYIARFATGLRRPRNRIVGRELAGRVDAIGDRVERFKPGDQVFGWSAGALAEYVAVPENSLAPKPSNLTAEEAAPVPVSAFTALQALRDKGGVEPGQHVLIIGASGGVGTFAVQIAKALGARVTGVCSSANVELVRSLGADRVVDYTREDVTADSRYDLIVDLVGDRSLSDLRRELAPSGTLVLVGGSGGRWFKGTDRFLRAMLLSPFVQQRLRPLVHADRQDDLLALKEMIEAGRVAPVISARFPMSEVAEAVGHFKAGHARGKVVIAI